VYRLAEVTAKTRSIAVSPEGGALLAHELTHVVQQGFSSGSQAPAQTRRLGAAR